MKIYKQIATLPYRVQTELEICLVTSRETGRWVLPKGWAKPGISDPDMALIEAQEEAGLEGQLYEPAIGAYKYTKKLHTFALVTCEVSVYALHVQEEQSSWPEKLERRRHWFTKHQASQAIEEQALRQLIEAFEPGRFPLMTES